MVSPLKYLASVDAFLHLQVIRLSLTRFAFDIEGWNHYAVHCATQQQHLEYKLKNTIT